MIVNQRFFPEEYRNGIREFRGPFKTGEPQLSLCPARVEIDTEGPWELGIELDVRVDIKRSSL